MMERATRWSTHKDRACTMMELVQWSVHDDRACTHVREADMENRAHQGHCLGRAAGPQCFPQPTLSPVKGLMGLCNSLLQHR